MKPVLNKSKTILIAGGSGTIGKHLCKKLLEQGNKVSVLSRNKSNRDGIKSYLWDLGTDFIDDEAIYTADYIINLAGASIGEKRWSDKRKKQIVDSRVKSTKLLFNRFHDLNKYPEAYISASAIGYYGAVTYEKIFSENDPPANDFLGYVCSAWENESNTLERLGTRVVKLRTGLVLNNGEGALSKMMIPTKLFLGSPLGSGKQYINWIHIDDLCNVYIKALADNNMNGVYNVVAPEYITNKDFMRLLAETINKPFWLPNVPSILIKIIYGEMANMVLEGSKISSQKLLNSGYSFLYPNLKSALNSLLK